MNEGDRDRSGRNNTTGRVRRSCGCSKYIRTNIKHGSNKGDKDSRRGRLITIGTRGIIPHTILSTFIK